MGIWDRTADTPTTPEIAIGDLPILLGQAQAIVDGRSRLLADRRHLKALLTVIDKQSGIIDSQAFTVKALQAALAEVQTEADHIGSELAKATKDVDDALAALESGLGDRP